MRLSPPLDPSADQARSWLREELARPRYNARESLQDRILRWIEELLNATPGTIGFGQVLSVALLAVAVAAIVILVVVSIRNAARVTHSDTASVFDEPALSAAEHRARAQSLKQRGDYAAAALEAYRAVVARSAERVLIDATPGRTARELSAELTAAFPEQESAIEDATATFVGVRYGERSVSPAEVDAILDLDDRLVATRPAQAGVAS